MNIYTEATLILKSLIFADTSFFIGLASPWDQWHEQAKQAFDATTPIVTSSLIINETISLFQLRGFSSFALEFLDRVQIDPSLTIIYPDSALQEIAWKEFKQSGSFGANAVDCMSFAIMRTRGIKRAYTFDKAHFQAAGFEAIP